MLTFYVPINSTSLGASAFHIVKHINEEFRLLPIGGGLDASSFEPVSDETKVKISQAYELGSTQMDVKGHSLKLWHPFAGIERVTCSQGLYTFHELDSITPMELNSLNQQEYIIVPCQYNKTVFQNCGVKPPIYVVPLGVDRSVFYPLEKYQQKTGPFIFTMAGKFEARKFHLEILQAFVSLFRDNPNVKLRCCIENRFVNMQEMYGLINQRIFGGKPPSNVEFLGWLPTERHFADFLSHSDCFISPSRGESFNLPLLQAMSCGVRVITNADHAHADYVNNDNAILVKSHRTVQAFDGMFFKNDNKVNTGKWFDVHVNEIAQAMITAFQKGRGVNVNGIETAKKFDWKNTTEQILKICHSSTT